MDDLYNNLKIYEPEVKGTSNSSTNTQNVAFVSINYSTNGVVNTTHGATTASTQATAINSTTIDNLSDAVICAFFASQPNNPQLDNEDSQQIYLDDLEEMDLADYEQFPVSLTADQISDLEKPVSSDEIRKAVWSCSENKSPGPDGFTFEFFRKYWDSIGQNICITVECFSGKLFAKGFKGVDNRFHGKSGQKVLASKKYGGLGVPFFYGPNRALLFRWVGRFLSHDNSLWIRFIYQPSRFFFPDTLFFPLFELVCLLFRKFPALKLQRSRLLLSHCKLRVGSYANSLLEDLWLGDVPFNELSLGLRPWRTTRNVQLAVKMQGEIYNSFAPCHGRWGNSAARKHSDLVRIEMFFLMERYTHHFFPVTVALAISQSYNVDGGTFLRALLFLFGLLEVV
ncbi:hypothetical protein Tco_0573880 [Tanacetum coccineum]